MPTVKWCLPAFTNRRTAGPSTTRRHRRIQEQENVNSYTLFLFGISTKNAVNKLSLLSVFLVWQYQVSQIPSSTELTFKKYRRLISFKTLPCYGKYNTIQTLRRAVGSRKEWASNVIRWSQHSKPLKYVKASDLGCSKGGVKTTTEIEELHLLVPLNSELYTSLIGD